MREREKSSPDHALLTFFRKIVNVVSIGFVYFRVYFCDYFCVYFSGTFENLVC